MNRMMKDRMVYGKIRSTNAWKELENSEVDASKNEDEVCQCQTLKLKSTRLLMQNRRKEKTLSGLKVMVRGDDLNGALRVLKKRMQTEGVFNELRERTAFRSRGEKKRLQRSKLVEEGG